MNPTQEIPLAPGALPLIGHMVPLLRSPLAFLNSLPGQGDLVRIRIGPWDAIMVCDPELTHAVLVDDRTFDKGGPIYDRGREVGGNGLITCPHAEHRRQRRLVQPAFHQARMPGYAGVMSEHADRVTTAWYAGQTIDAYREVLEITSRTLVMALFGETLSPAVNDQMVEDVHVIFGGVFDRMLTPPPLDRIPTPGKHRYDRALIRLRHVSSKIIADCRAHDTADPAGLMAILTAAREDDGSGMTDTELGDQILSFLVAGESTANLLAWTLHLLSTRPDVVADLRQETDRILSSGRAATWVDLPELRFTGRVLTESLRLYPPLWIATRATTRDTDLGGHALRAGTHIAISPYLLHHRPDLYPDPERFDPDRWDSDKSANPPRHSFIAFGAGARKCVGDDFAMAEASLTLATIASRWNLAPAGGRPVRAARSALLKPDNLQLRVIART